MHTNDLDSAINYVELKRYLVIVVRLVSGTSEEDLSSRAAGGAKPRSGEMPQDGEGTQNCRIFTGYRVSNYR